MPELIEDRVRRSLDRHAAAFPVPDADPTDAAVGAAHRLRARRRHRIALSTAAAVLAVVLGAVGTATALGHHPAPRPGGPAPTGPASNGSAPSGQAGVDLVVGGAIRTAGGGSVPLPPPVAATTVQRGWRVSGGWLLVTGGRDSLVLVSTAGELRWRSPGLVDAVSADGTTLVWWDGSRVRYGRIGPDGVTGAVDVAFPPGTEDPQADVDGLWHGKVVLRYPAAGQLSSLALWDPAHPRTVAAGSDLQVVQTFGPAADGRHLVVLTARADGGDPRCLVEVDPDRGFAPAGGNATACPADLPTVLIESPDHRWLGTPTAPGRGEPDRWYDLGTLFDGTPGTRTVPGCAVSGAGVTMTTWEPAGSYLVVRTNDGAGHPVPVTFTRCRPGDPAATAVPDPRLAGATRVAVLATRSSTAWG